MTRKNEYEIDIEKIKELFPDDKNLHRHLDDIKKEYEEKEKNIIENYAKNKESLEKKEPKLNIIQLPNKKIQNNKELKTIRNNNNKSITIKNVIKTNNNYKIININKTKNKSLNKNNKNNKISKIYSLSNPKPIPKKLSPSPNQKNIFLKRYIDKSKSKPKDNRGFSGNNIRNTRYNKAYLMKKQISPNTLKKIFGKNKFTSNKKVLNNSIRKI